MVADGRRKIIETIKKIHERQLKKIKNYEIDESAWQQRSDAAYYYVLFLN